MYILNIASAIKKMTVNEFIDKLVFNRQLLFSETSEKKDLQLFATKLTEEIPDPSNSKKYCQSYLKKKTPQNW